jgi:signal peptide peptidase SppA
MKTFPHIRRALAGKLWYVHEQKMQEMLAFLEIKLAGGSSVPEVIESIRAVNQAAAARSQQTAARPGAIAVIPVYGLIMHRQMADISGGSSGTSTAVLSAALQQAVADPGVSSIVLDIDSPGGDVDGVDELAAEILIARKQKKITAVSNCLCASAAYYLAAQASEIVVSPSSLTGSIGVYTMHEDDSAMLEAAGIKLELIKFGENKAEGNSLGPLSDSAREHLQQIVDTYGNAFEKAVARGRGIKQDEVHSKFGQGRVFDAKTAVRIGMADRVGTLADVLAQVSSGSKGSGSGRAQFAVFGVDPSAIGTTESRTFEPHEIAALVSCKGGCGTVLWAQAHKDYCHECEAKLEAERVAVPINAKTKTVRADDGCTCDCVPCDGGDCDDCSHDDCACEGCMCETAVGKRNAKMTADELAKTRARGFDRMRHELSQAAAR